MEDIHIYEFRDFRLDTKDTTNDRLLRRGQPLKIPDKEFSLLCILVERHGQEIDKEYLIEKLWPDTYRNELNAPHHMVDDLKESNRSKLYRQISSLKKTLGDEDKDGDKDKITIKKGMYRFAAEVKEIQETAKDEVYIFLKFKMWSFKDKTGRKLTFLLTTGIAISLIYSIVYTILNRGLISGKGFRLAGHLSIIQFLMILGVFIHSMIKFSQYTKGFQKSGSNLDTTLMKTSGYGNPEMWEEAKSSAEIVVKQYARYWKFLLSSWVLLYLMFAVNGYFSSSSDSNKELLSILTIIINIFNNYNSLMITLCFLVLNNPAAFSEKVKNKKTLRSTMQPGIKGRIVALFRFIMQPGVAGGITIGVVALAEFLLVYGLGYQQRPLNENPVTITSDVMSGLIGGVTLALFVGRLQSKFLNPPSWLPIALYFYVAIQPLFMFINHDVFITNPDLIRNISGALIIEIALILKCLLYLYTVWLFNSRRLLFYFVRVTPLYERGNVDWKDFLINL
jgi:DNA-binding winged helix-turn-helix (wHTH) protein